MNILVARLINYDLHKRVYGTYEPPKFIDIVKDLTERGIYDSYILENYDENDFKYFESIIDHERDNTFSLAGMGQMTGKYLLRNRADESNKVYYETPQVLYMAVACVLMAKYKDKLGVSGRRVDP